MDFPDGAAPPPLALDSIGAVVDTFPGFACLADQRQTDVFAGAETSKATDLFTDLVEAEDVRRAAASQLLASSGSKSAAAAGAAAAAAAAKPGASAAAAGPASASAAPAGDDARPSLSVPETFADLVELLQRTLARCNKLVQKAQTATGDVPLMQLMAHLEATFLRRLPTPEPWSPLTPERARRAKACGITSLPMEEQRAMLWEPLTLDLAVQRRALDLLTKLLRIQTAAISSVPYSRDGYVRQLLTAAAIGACVHHVLFLRAGPVPSPLTTVLIEGASDVDTAADSGVVLGARGAAAGGPPMSEEEQLAAAIAASMASSEQESAAESKAGEEAPAADAASRGAADSDAGPGSGGKGDGDASPPDFAVSETRPEFHLPFRGVGGASLAALTDRMLVTDPTIAKARSRLLTFWTVTGEQGQAVFEFDPANASYRGLQMNAQVPEFKLMLKLLSLTGHRFDLPKRTIRSDSEGADPTDVERAFRWMASDELEEAPELPLAVSLVTTMRLGALYDPLGRILERKIWGSSQMRLLLGVSSVNGGDQQAVASVTALVAGKQLSMFSAQADLPSHITDPHEYVSGNYAEKLSAATATGRRSGRRRRAAPPAAVQTTEQDVRRSKDPPTFDDALSWQDSEQLLSFLTAPYVQIPLVLRFFAADRLGALFHKRLRVMLERVLFEPRTHDAGALHILGDGDDLDAITELLVE